MIGIPLHQEQGQEISTIANTDSDVNSNKTSWFWKWKKKMSGQKYKRTNFEDDDNTSGAGTPPGGPYDAAVVFKAGASYWQHRSVLERVLLVLVLALTLTVIITIAILATHPHASTLTIVVHPNTSNLCTSPVCVTVASSVINSMDTDVDPCDDFYKYSCGGWIKSHYIPSGQSRWGTFGVLWKENQLVMKKALENPMNTLKGEAERKAKMYYESCMDNNKTIQDLGAKPMLDLIKQIGDWKVLSPDWSVSNFKFQDVLHKVHKLGLNNFFDVWVGEDEKESTKNILQLDQSGLMLSRDYYLNKTIEEDKILSAYLKYATTLCVLLGGDKNQTEKQLLDVIEFEQKIANITVPQEERRDDMKLYHKINISDLQALAPFINWLDYINSQVQLSGYKVDPSEKIIVFAPKFLQKISALVKEYLKTDEGKIIINNYLMWPVVKYLAPFLSKPFRNAKKEFSEVLTGTKGKEEEWRYCVTDTDGTIGFALGAMFVREAFNGDSKKKAEGMIAQIKAAFKGNLPNLSWMDNDTREKAKEKANAVVDMIGFPEYILNQTALDKKYEEFKVNPDEYFMNNVRAMHFNTKKNFDKLRKKKKVPTATLR